MSKHSLHLQSASKLAAFCGNRTGHKISGVLIQNIELKDESDTERGRDYLAVYCQKADPALSLGTRAIHTNTLQFPVQSPVFREFYTIKFQLRGFYTYSLSLSVHLHQNSNPIVMYQDLNEASHPISSSANRHLAPPLALLAGLAPRWHMPHMLYGVLVKQ